MSVKEIRLQTGMSQNKFAEMFTIPVSTLRDWEQGRRTPSDYVVNMMQKILELQGYHMDELNWEWIRNKCCEYGFISHDAGTCGLHVHVNRNFFGNTQNEIDLNIAKVVLLVNRFWESHMIPFSRRTEEQLNHWASKNEITLEDDDNDATLACKARDLRNKGRYYAVNLRNANTIEFRLFRGTL